MDDADLDLLSSSWDYPGSRSYPDREIIQMVDYDQDRGIIQLVNYPDRGLST